MVAAAAAAVVIVIVAVAVAVGARGRGAPLWEAALVQREGRGRLVVRQQPGHAVQAVGHGALAGPQRKLQVHLRTKRPISNG